MTVAIPDSPLLKPLTEHAEGVCERLGWKLVRVPEAKAADMLLKYSADLALITPLGYALGVGRVDYRVIQGACVMLNNYTNVAGIDFREGAEDVKTCASKSPEDFLCVIGRIVLAEKLELELGPLQPSSAAPPADCNIDYVSAKRVPALDVTEEWWDLTERPLPLAFWTCRIEADLDHVQEAVELMRKPDLVPIIINEPVDSETLPRQGSVTYTWDEDTETSITAACEMLFFHQYIPEIPAVKILGRD